MNKEIKRVAVLGSGVMGAGIAAHLAGAGFESLLLDIVPKDLAAGESRNKLSVAALERLKTSKPSLIFSPSDLKKIIPGNFEDDWNQLKTCQWIIEVVVERLDIKQKVFERVDQVITPGTIVSSNTSGLSLKGMLEGRSASFKKNFCITHFFNPVRYMKLVELVSGPETDPEVACFMAGFLSNQLGKGVVIAKDTPNFIANRIGVYSWMSCFHDVLKNGYGVGEADKILGPAIGRPKSATFRTGDLVGLDTMIHVANNSYDTCPADEARAIFKLPSVLTTMVEKKMLGDKTGQGFYKKVKKEDGTKDILALNLQTLEYEAQGKVRYDSLGEVKNCEELEGKYKIMVNAKDRAGELAWRSLRDALVYSANRIPEIADDIVNIDNAMKWGFNWEHGPFEIWDILGVQETAARIESEGGTLPSLVKELLKKGEGTFYKKDKGQRFYFDGKTGSYKPVTVPKGVIQLASLKDQKKMVKTSASASLLDIGDGVFNLEFTSKMNAIDDDIIEMMNFSVDYVEKSGVGLVISNESQNFSVGANLMLIFMEAQNQNWTGIEKVVRDFQKANMRLRYSSKPVVAAPFGMTLGGGCEVSMGADVIRAHAELYMGLVELGVGLIPAGGGCKEMIRRMDDRCKFQFAKGLKNVAPQNLWMLGDKDGGPFPKVQMAFETIGFAKVSSSAKEAQFIGYLAPTDKISLSRDRLIGDAKQDVLDLAKNYVTTKPRDDISLPGRGGTMAIHSAIAGFRASGKISEHDEAIAKKLAHILTAGDSPVPVKVSEQHLLDLECEAFLSLVGMEKTQERMSHMLMKGKPLRN